MNTENLIQNKNLTPSERRRNASKAGKASGVARRKKANLKKMFDTLLTSDVSNKDLKKQLKNMGLDTTNEVALGLAMLNKAIKGDVRAFESITDIIKEDKKEDLVSVNVNIGDAIIEQVKNMEKEYLRRAGE